MPLNPNLIQQIQIRTQKRLQAKQELDSYINLALSSNKEDKTITLSASSESGTYRLLDEGFIVDSDGYPLFYIMKNSIQNFYDQLSDNYVGSINIGHMDFATFPYLVGEWTKKDLSVVDIGDGRKGLDVKPRFNQDSMFIKELKAVNYPIGLSSEFKYKLDLDASEEYGLDMVNELEITDFAIVGEAGNVGSSNIKLKGSGKMSNKKESIFERFFNKYDEDGKKLNAKDPVVEPTDPKAKDPETDPEDKPEVDPEEDLEPSEVDYDKKLEDAAKIIEDQAEKITNLEESQTKALALMEKMEAHIEALEETNKKLSASNTDLSESAEKGLSHFESVVKKLNLTTESTVVAKKKATENKEEAPAITDGFGEV